ncbi:hypothetical protein V1527DRAFT_493468 [Lipomyces starkeyi]
MARPSKKSIQRSINGRKNALKRFDTASQPTQHYAEVRGKDAEEFQVVEVRLSQSEIDNALKRLSFRPEADKRLKYTTRPGGSERSIRRFKAKFRNVLNRQKSRESPVSFALLNVLQGFSSP